MSKLKIKDNTIYPTGTCFDDALDFIMRERPKEYLLVHGICTADDGDDYAHAWVEAVDQKTAIGFGLAEVDGKKVEIGYEVDIEEFYERMRVSEKTKYGFWDMVRENHAKGTYGPWEEKYLKLCKDYKA